MQRNLSCFEGSRKGLLANFTICPFADCRRGRALPRLESEFRGRIASVRHIPLRPCAANAKIGGVSTQDYQPGIQDASQRPLFKNNGSHFRLLRVFWHSVCSSIVCHGGL